MMSQSLMLFWTTGGNTVTRIFKTADDQKAIKVINK
jgi:hypothetical protein